MPETTWTTGDNITAALMNQIEDQLVVTCTSSTRPTGAEGRMIAETDNDMVRVYDGTNWRPFGGFGWVSFTPTWQNVTQGTGATNVGQYHYQPGGVLVRAQLTLGTGGSVTGDISLTIPNSHTTPSTGPVTLGVAQFKDGSGDTDGLARVDNSDTTIALYSGTNEANATNPFTFGNGDQIIVTIMVPLS